MIAGSSSTTMVNDWFIFLLISVKLLPDTLVYQDKLALWTGKEGHGK